MRNILALVVMTAVLSGGIWYFYNLHLEEQRELADAAETAHRRKLDAFIQCPNQPGQVMLCTNAIVLDLGQAGILMSNVTNRFQVYWNADNDDFAEKTDWIGPEDGLLAVDRNADGMINDHSELLGTPTVSAYDMLKSFDSDSNSVIDAQDAQFSTLKIWQDGNLDGISQPREVTSLASQNIAALYLSPARFMTHETARPVIADFTFAYANGVKGRAVNLKFDYDNLNSRYIKPFITDENAAAIINAVPDIKG